MLFAPLHRHLPKTPLSRRDQSLRAELTHLSTVVVKLEREQETQLRRIAEIQQELDEIKRLIRKIGTQ
jgi:predicted  nucleic acid-binding Zn-ribbon protein